MWEELEHYTTYRPSYVKDATIYKKHVEAIQVFEFLAGLNSEYEHVGAHILNMALPLTLDEVYAHNHKEEGRRGVMNMIPFIKKSALVSSSIRGDCSKFTKCGHGGQFSNSSDDKDRLKCEHVIDLGTPKTNVGTFMDGPKT